MKNTNNFFYFVIAAFFLVFVGIKCAVAGITYDEAWTLESFVPQSVYDIYFYTSCDANNHLLNTLFIKFLFSFLPNELFIARCPNLLAFVVYLWYGIKLCKWQFQNVLGPVIFFLLIANPFVLDFFSLARGYGLMLGLIMPMIFYLFKYFESGKLSALTLVFVFATLTCLSNFSSIHLELALFCTIWFMWLFRTALLKKTSVFLMLIFTVLLFILLYAPVSKLKANGNLYYGGTSGIYSDTLMSLTKYSMYSQYASSMVVVCLNIFLILLLLVLFVSLRRSTAMRPLTISLFLLIFCFASEYLQALLLDNLYLTDRTALFLYPLLILCLGLALNELEYKIVRVVASLLTFLFALNCIFHLNTIKSITWYFDSRSEEVINFLRKNNPAHRAGLQASWPLSKSLQYYKRKNFPELIFEFKQPEQAIKDGDYYLYLDAAIDQVDYQKGREILTIAKKDTLLRFPSEHLYLFKLKSQN